MPGHMTFASMTRSANPDTFEPNDALGRSSEPPELWLVRLFAALLLHTVLLFGVRSAWVKIAVPEKAGAGTIEFVEVGTVESDVLDTAKPQAEGVAPLRSVKLPPGEPTTPDQTEIVAAMPKPAPIASPLPSPEPKPLESGEPKPIKLPKPIKQANPVERSNPNPTPKPNPNPNPTPNPNPNPTPNPTPNPNPTLNPLTTPPTTGDGKKPGDIASNTPNPLRSQGFGTVLNAALSPVSKGELKATQASIRMPVVPPQTVPTELKLAQGEALKINVQFSVQLEQLIPDSLSLSDRQSPRVQKLSQARLKTFIESILRQATFEVEIQTDGGAPAGSASTWDAIVEIQVAAPGKEIRL
jgi:outer membrane biosynthesis protein TonB